MYIRDLDDKLSTAGRVTVGQTEGAGQPAQTGQVRQTGHVATGQVGHVTVV